MMPLELLRVGLEAAIAVQFALFAVYLMAMGDKRRPAGFFLSTLCAALVTAVLLNALASAGVAPSLRTLNYFIDLSSPALLLGFVARAGEDEPPLRRSDWLHVLAPLAGGAVLASGSPHGPDLSVLAVQAGYLTVAALIGRRRATALRSFGLLNLTRVLLGAFALVMVLRIWVMIDARLLQSYRESIGYLLILAVVLALASFLLWAALRRPGLLAWQAAVAPSGLSGEDAAALERRLLELIDGQQLHLQPSLTLADVAGRLGASPRHVSFVISSRLSNNFRGLMNRRRAEAAARALRSDGQVSVTNVMFDAGFGSKSAFQREFKRCFGVSPTEYRQHALEQRGRAAVNVSDVP